MAKRRSNGEGNIRKRKDGRWEGRYTAGLDPVTGKQVFKNVLGKTQTEVKEKLKKALEENQKIDYALFNATKFVCNWNPLFTDYLAKKRSEGKHYNVAISHAAKKLVRLIFAMQKTGQPYSAKS